MVGLGSFLFLLSRRQIPDYAPVVSHPCTPATTFTNLINAFQIKTFTQKDISFPTARLNNKRSI